MIIKYINTDTGEEIKPTYITNYLVLMDAELWEIAFGRQEDDNTLCEGWAWKINQPFKIEIS